MEIDSIIRGQITEDFSKTEADKAVPELAFVIPSYNHPIDGQTAEIGLLFTGRQYFIVQAQTEFQKHLIVFLLDLNLLLMVVIVFRTCAILDNGGKSIKN